MGALAHVGAVSKAAPPLARVEIEGGLAVISVGDRIVLVDCSDFRPLDKEMVVIRHDGRLAVERCHYGVRSSSNPRDHFGAEVIEGRQRCRYGVTVVGRVVRYLN